jgi:hypothetical protein
MKLAIIVEIHQFWQFIFDTILSDCLFDKRVTI